MFCSKCGSKLNNGEKFCGNCGKAIGGGIKSNSNNFQLKKIIRTGNKKLIIALVGIAVITCIGFGIRSYMISAKVKEKLSIGNKYLQESNYDQANKAFNEAINIDNKNVDARIGIGKAYLEDNKLSEGEKVLKEALGINNTEAKVYTALSDIYEKEKDYTNLVMTLGQGVSSSKNKAELQTRLNEIIHNIDVIEVKADAEQGEKFEMPENVQVQMNKVKFELPVKWDVENVDTSKTGIQKITGTVQTINKGFNFSINVKMPRGNFIGNQINGGTVAYKNNTIYFANPQDGGKLYKCNEDGTSKTKLSDDIPLNINVYKDYIYYELYSGKEIDVANNEGRDIYKIKNDGTARELFLKDGGTDFQIVGDDVYYTIPIELPQEQRVPHYYPKDVYKISLANNSKTKMGMTQAYSMYIEDNKTAADKSDSKTHSLNILGNDRYIVFSQDISKPQEDNRNINDTTIAKALWNACIIGISEDQIYFYSMHVGNDSDGICKISKNPGSNYSLIKKLGSGEYLDNNYIAAGNNLYEISKGALYTYNDSDSKVKIKDLNVNVDSNRFLSKTINSRSEIFFAGDKLVYFDKAGEIQFEKIK